MSIKGHTFDKYDTYDCHNAMTAHWNCKSQCSHEVLFGVEIGVNPINEFLSQRTNICIKFFPSASHQCRSYTMYKYNKNFKL